MTGATLFTTHSDPLVLSAVGAIGEKQVVVFVHSPTFLCLIVAGRDLILHKKV